MKKTQEIAPQQQELVAPSNGNLVSLTIPQPAPITDGTAMIERVTKLEIVNAETYEIMAMVRYTANMRMKQVQEERKKLKEPSLEAGRRIDAFFNPAIETFAKVAETASDKMRAFDREQQQIADQKRKEAEEAARKERHQREMAIQEISGIQQQAIIAQIGRAGVRKGGTLECIDATLTETENWPIDSARFGGLTEAAQKAKETAIATIKAFRESFLAQQERARIERERTEAAAAGNAERTRKAEEEAKTARQAEIEARKNQLRAESQLRDSQTTTQAAVAQSEAKAQELEIAAIETKPDMPMVPGLSRPKVWKWKLLDKAKLSSDLLLVDEKAIGKIVVAMKERAHSVVGVGAIEIYQEESLRQR